MVPERCTSPKRRVWYSGIGISYIPLASSASFWHHVADSTQIDFGAARHTHAHTHTHTHARKGLGNSSKVRDAVAGRQVDTATKRVAARTCGADGNVQCISCTTAVLWCSTYYLHDTPSMHAGARGRSSAHVHVVHLAGCNAANRGEAHQAVFKVAIRACTSGFDVMCVMAVAVRGAVPRCLPQQLGWICCIIRQLRCSHWVSDVVCLWGCPCGLR